MNIKIQKIIIITTICFLITTGFSTSFAFQNYKNIDLNQYNSINDRINNEIVATCYLFNPDGVISKDIIISYEKGLNLVKLCKESNDDLLKKSELINNLIDLGFINDESFNLEKPGWLDIIKPFKSSSTGKSFFCSIASAGSGKTTPIVLLPRPRAILSWNGYEDPQFAITTVGSLTKNKGFIAHGSQQGTAIGFVGLGITYGTPYGTIYGFTGYALYTSVTADLIEFYPPNSKPAISSPNPSDGEENVPITLSELNFRIDDADNDLMSYIVTTNPNIGLGDGNNKGNGIYSVPIDGIQSSTTYSWTVVVSDGMDTTEKTYSFTTVFEAPVISNPIPFNGEFVSTDLSQLSFSLSDPQGDLMDYTVETSPDVGSKQESDVGDGIVIVPINSLEKDEVYHWYINVTDGANWKREVFVFSTNENNLVGYWSFDEGSGTIAYDSSGFENDGIIYGASWTNGISGNALIFDGVDDYVDIGNDESLKIELPASISLLVKIADFSDDEGARIFTNDKWDYPKGYYGCHIGIKTDPPKIIYLSYGDGQKGGLEDRRNKFGSTQLNTNEWYYIVGVIIGPTDMDIYINGKNDGGYYEGSGGPIAYSESSGFISQSGFFNRYFNGIIDEVKFYNDALTEEEIQELYLNQKNLLLL